jgi:phosphohistidine phosphatase SixA
MVMTHLDLIADSIRKQRKSVDDALESTSHRSMETASIIAKIEELRARAEATRLSGGAAPEPARRDKLD